MLHPPPITVEKHPDAELLLFNLSVLLAPVPSPIIGDIVEASLYLTVPSEDLTRTCVSASSLDGVL